MVVLVYGESRLQYSPWSHCNSWLNLPLRGLSKLIMYSYGKYLVLHPSQSTSACCGQEVCLKDKHVYQSKGQGVSQMERQEAKAAPPRAKWDRKAGRRGRSSEGKTKELRGWMSSQHISEESSLESSAQHHSDLREPVAERIPPTAAAFPLQLPKRGDQPPPPGELKGWGEGVAVPSGLWASATPSLHPAWRGGSSIRSDLKSIHSVLCALWCLVVTRDHAMYWMNLGVKKQQKFLLPWASWRLVAWWKGNWINWKKR